MSDSALLDRSKELEAIGLRLDRACRGDGSLAVIEGPAGIGKTTLVKAAVALARERGMTVLQGRGGVLEQQLEYGVARQLVERPVLQADPERRAQLLAGPAAASSAALGMGGLPADPGGLGDPSPEIQHALHWLVANMAEEAPILIALDDAHWGDPASLRAGGYLARRRRADLPAPGAALDRGDRDGPGQRLRQRRRVALRGADRGLRAGDRRQSLPAHRAGRRAGRQPPRPGAGTDRDRRPDRAGRGAPLAAPAPREPRRGGPVAGPGGGDHGW